MKGAVCQEGLLIGLEVDFTGNALIPIENPQNRSSIGENKEKQGPQDTEHSQKAARSLRAIDLEQVRINMI